MTAIVAAETAADHVEQHARTSGIDSAPPASCILDISAGSFAFPLHK